MSFTGSVGQRSASVRGRPPRKNEFPFSLLFYLSCCSFCSFLDICSSLFRCAATSVSCVTIEESISPFFPIVGELSSPFFFPSTLQEFPALSNFLHKFQTASPLASPPSRWLILAGLHLDARLARRGERHFFFLCFSRFPPLDHVYSVCHHHFKLPLLVHPPLI